MSEQLKLVLTNRQRAWAAVKGMLFPAIGAAMQSGRRWVLTLRPENRTEQQNRLMWPLLAAFSEQLKWPVNGRMTKMAPEEWKDVLTAAFRKEQRRLAMGLDGGVVMLGQRTSRFTKAEFSEWIEFIYATASARGVELPAWTTVEDETHA